MSRQRLRIPTRNFKIRGRRTAGVQSREEIRRNREAAKPEVVVEPVKVEPVMDPPVKPTPPAAPRMNPSRGVYMDTVKKPTLSSNARVEIASPSVDTVKNEQFKNEFAQSLKNEANVEEKAENLKSNTSKDVKAEKPAKKKKFLFW